MRFEFDAKRVLRRREERNASYIHSLGGYTLCICLGLGQARRFVLSDETRLVEFCYLDIFSLGYSQEDLHPDDEISFCPLGFDFVNYSSLLDASYYP